MFRTLTALGAAGLLLAQPAAAAVASFTFNKVDASAGLGSGPFGTVQVTENANGLDFVFTLAAGFRIHDGNANHNAFGFKIVGDPNVTVSNLTAGFAAINTATNSDISSPPFGDYFTGIDCTTACGPGFGGGFAGPLSFRVTSASALTLASLGFNTVNASNIYFTSDLVIANGNTGNVGAVINATPAIPEPATWAMMLLGFGGMGYAVRRRTNVSARIRFA